MANGRITIDVGLETRGVAKGAKSAERALKDLEDAAGDAGKDGGRDLDKLEDELKDVQRQSEKTGRSVDDIGDGAKKGFRRAGGASSEFKDEALANFSEVTSSFDGSMESIGELAQGTLGGVAANIPGIGVAAGAAAVGVGLITSEMTKAQEKSAEIKGNIIDDFLELGDALDKEAVDARVRDILGAEDTRKEAKLLAEILDINVGQAALAMAGDFESAGVTIDQVMEGIESASGNVDLATWESLKGTINATTEAMQAGKDAADAQAEAQKRTAQTVATEQGKNQAALDKTYGKALKLSQAEFNALVKVGVVDRTGPDVDRIVRRIRGTIASIQISAGIGGKQML